MKTDIKHIDNFYFLGIGGIGMSALARYFNTLGKNVAGYDKTPTELTQKLETEGIAIHFTDAVSAIPAIFLNPETTLIIRTPAVPEDHSEFNYFTEKGFTILKRAEVLGELFNSQRGIAVAGTHGKTTISTMISYILHEAGFNNSAFLGGISKNLGTNMLIGTSDWIVAEADEFDRSFLRLYPEITIVTAIDADHLDIYTDKAAIVCAFNAFVGQIKPAGILIHKIGLPLVAPENVLRYTYALDNPQADFYATNMQQVNGRYTFDLETPYGTLKGFKTQHPGLVNVENSVAALAACKMIHATDTACREALASFTGIKRRFDEQVLNEKMVYIDDYAHHPKEIEAVVKSVKAMYPDKKVTGIFQPHLFTRTRDFADEFAESLSLLDSLILMDIYPAREKPIEGVSSDLIFDTATPGHKIKCSKENLLATLKEQYIEVLLTLGAGDIDQFVEPIKKMLTE